MPTPPRPAPPRTGLTRRTALTASTAVAALVAGCTPHRVATPAVRPAETGGVALDPDVALAAATLEHEQALVDLLEATAHRHRRLDHVLAGALGVHRQHVRLLSDAVPPVARPGTSSASGAAGASASPQPSAAAESTAGASPSGTPSPSSPASPAGPHVPRTPERALRALVAAENQLSLEDKRAAFAASSGVFARLLASMAAAAAQQAAVLDGLRAGGGR